MNIVIDIRALMSGKVSGVEVYIRELLSHLFKIDHKNTYILFANASHDQSPFLPSFQQENISVIQTKIPNKLFNVALSFFSRPKLDKLILEYLKRNPSKCPKTLKRFEIDLFFMPDLRLSALSKKVKKVVTVHDLSFEHYPRFFSFKTRLWYKLLRPRREILKSDKVIAVSHFTAHDLVQTYQVPVEKIETIWEGVNKGFCEKVGVSEITKVRKKYHLPLVYFLFLSTLEPRKNLLKLIEAFRLFKEKYPQFAHIKLVIGGRENKKIFSRISLPVDPDILFTGFIPEEEKALILKGAKAFVYPSLFEGFGLPLLEAMKCGVPLITSRLSSLPEIVGDAGLLVDPENVEEMAHALAEIQKEDIREQLQRKMLQQIKKFSWEDCAEKTLKIFESLDLDH